MAPKLNQWNVTAETLALHAHEVAHLLGADEKEARDLQMRIVDFIMREDAIDHIIELDSLLGTNKPLGMARWSLHTLLHSPHQETLLETIVGHVSHSLEQLDKSIGQYRKVPLTSDHFVHGVIRANYLMLYALQSACALRSGGETQMTCQIWIDHYFSNDASVSLGTLIERISDVPRKFPHAMDTIMVHYPKGTQDITKSLGGLLTFLDEMERSIESTSQFKLVIETIQ
jgi:hypothetical protein